MIVVIPACGPDENLITLAKNLAKDERCRVIIVNDGADAASASVFEEAGKYAEILQSPGEGRGAALKTAYAHIADGGDQTADEFVVTVETNGTGTEDTAAAIESLCRAHEAEPDALVIGERNFRGKFPVGSRLLRSATRLIFAMTTGVRLKDTLSGFRTFPVKLLGEMLKTDSRRGEFETKQLLRFAKENVPIVRTEIDAVYSRENWSGHAFRGFTSVCKTLFSFIGSSFTSWLIDYALLLILYSVFKQSTGGVGIKLFGMTLEPKLPAIVIARTVSSAVNFALNSKLVFRSSSKYRLIKYCVNVIAMLVLNYILLRIITAAGVPIALAQILAQLIVYPLNFICQRKFVFG